MPSALPKAHGLGILLFLAGLFFFALNDALGKWLVADYGVGQMMALRAIGAGIVLAPMVWRFNVSLFDAGHWRLQILRVLCMALDTFCFYYSTRYMPLVDVMTFYMAAPLIVTAFSALLLGETVAPYRWLAVGIGLIGVLIALQPSSALFSSFAPLPLFGATVFALGQTITRRLRETHWLQLIVWQFVGAGLIGAATLPWTWITPDRLDLALTLLLGLVAMLSFSATTRALALTPASVLAPLLYSSMLWGAVLGWIVWRDAPTPPILVGNAIIIGGGLFTLYLDQRRGAATS